MIQMESPKRKMQKKNDYRRHKLFRKIKRRRKAQAEAEQQIAEKQLRKKLKLPKFDTGDDARMVYLRDIVGHDPYTGQDILKTGERVNRRLSAVNVDQRYLSKVDAAERNKELMDLKEYMGDAAFDKYMSDLLESQFRESVGIIERYKIPTNKRKFNSGKDIHIKKSKRGTFTKAAKQHGMSVQSFANRVLRNPSKYSADMRKKANFARNASKWNK